MAPVAVYRLEHQSIPSRREYLENTFAGPWGGLVQLGERAWSMPSPANDGLDEIPKHEIFGFLDYDSINRWFVDDLEYMRREGYTVRMYLVPSGVVRFGKTQVVFDHKAKTLGGVEDDWIPVVERIGAPKGIPCELQSA